MLRKWADAVGRARFPGSFQKLPRGALLLLSRQGGRAARLRVETLSPLECTCVAWDRQRGKLTQGLSDLGGILSQLSLQRAAMQPEKFRRLRDVPAAICKDALDVLPFDAGQTGHSRCV